MAEDKYGREIPDTRPKAVPHNWARPLSLQEEIKRMVRIQLSQAADLQGAETFEESDDFDCDEDPEILLSPYEVPEGLPEALEAPDPDPPTPPEKKSLKTAKKAVSGDGSPDEPEEKPA